MCVCDIITIINIFVIASLLTQMEKCRAVLKCGQKISCEIFIDKQPELNANVLYTYVGKYRVFVFPKRHWHCFCHVFCIKKSLQFILHVCLMRSMYLSSRPIFCLLCIPKYTNRRVWSIYIVKRIVFCTLMYISVSFKVPFEIIMGESKWRQNNIVFSSLKLHSMKLTFNQRFRKRQPFFLTHKKEQFMF